MTAQRERIHRYVSEHPGIHFNQLARELDLATGQLQYHLKKLRRADDVVSESLYGRTHYFTPEYEESERGALAVAFSFLLVLSVVSMVPVGATDIEREASESVSVEGSESLTAKEEFSETDLLVTQYGMGGYYLVNISGDSANKEDTVSTGQDTASAASGDGKAVYPDEPYVSTVIRQTNISTGNEIGTKDLSSYVTEVAAVESDPVSDGYFVAGSEGQLLKVSSSDLSVEWSLDTTLGFPQEPTVSASENYIFVGGSGNNVLINRTSQDVEWSASPVTGRTERSRIYAERGYVYFTADSTAFKYNLDTGNKEYEIYTGNGIYSVASNGETVVTGTGSGDVRFAYASNGTAKANLSHANTIEDIMYEDGYFWMADGTGTILRYDSDGSNKESFSIGSNNLQHLERAGYSGGGGDSGKTVGARYPLPHIRI